MITVSKTRLGKYVAMGVGLITTDPTYRTVGDKGTKLCSFTLLSDKLKSGGVTTFDSYSVQVWGDDAAYASQFEKNDEIFVIGECKKDEYWSNKNGKDEFRIVAEMIVPKNIGIIVLQLQMAMKAFSDSNGEGQNKAESTDGFTDLDLSSIEIPKEFMDLEPDI